MNHLVAAAKNLITNIFNSSDQYEAIFYEKGSNRNLGNFTVCGIQHAEAIAQNKKLNNAYFILEPARVSHPSASPSNPSDERISRAAEKALPHEIFFDLSGSKARIVPAPKLDDRKQPEKQAPNKATQSPSHKPFSLFGPVATFHGTGPAMARELPSPKSSVASSSSVNPPNAREDKVTPVLNSDERKPKSILKSPNRLPKKPKRKVRIADLRIETRFNINDPPNIKKSEKNTVAVHRERDVGAQNPPSKRVRLSKSNGY